ncbi:UTP--glucose-1-phosphate uridylyltransferase [Paenibacillus luteus]|uniref:UTP--glucose-1-phosphate uridylyltransferase n=1 Tax=Paenibacillus luteus TaxID=2545753 RepID=UPI001F4FCF6A|nr:UTP--glucose-1-phosphate uridylyltransferase [Paenibacillus luteus]
MQRQATKPYDFNKLELERQMKEEVIILIRKAIIPAAGYGIRNLPITKAIPKELFPIGNRPAIDYVVKEAIDAGITDILIILSRNKTEIMNYFDRSVELESHLYATNKDSLLHKILPSEANIQYIRQYDALGLGHAVLHGQSFAAGEPFAVLLPDQLSLNRTSLLNPLIQNYEKYKTNIIGLQTVAPELLSQYGVASAKQLYSRVYEVDSIVEKPAHHPPSQLAVMGRYILEPGIFELLRKTRPGIGGEIQLTDALNQMGQTRKSIGYVYKERWYDTSIEHDYLKIQQRVYQMNKYNKL